jgi:ATP-dependent Clp protease adaptor protein ClpS
MAGGIAYPEIGCGGEMSPKRQQESGEPGVVTRTKPKAKPKLEKPKLYKVLLHNDDYTPMEFVVLVLVQVFRKSESDATSVMLHAHTHGYAVAGVYTFEVAETKVAETMKLAEQAQFPLLCTMEPE